MQLAWVDERAGLKLEGLVVEGGESKWVCVRVLGYYVRARVWPLLETGGAYNRVIGEVCMGSIWMEGLLR